MFGEDQGRFLVTIREADAGKVRELAGAANVPLVRIGVTRGSAIEAAGAFSVPIERIRRAHEEFFPRLMGPDAALA
jgi:phosphoribosylformylglycinamidine synthase